MFKINELIDFESSSEIHSNRIELMIKNVILNQIALNLQPIIFSQSNRTHQFDLRPPIAHG